MPNKKISELNIKEIKTICAACDGSCHKKGTEIDCPLDYTSKCHAFLEDNLGAALSRYTKEEENSMEVNLEDWTDEEYLYWKDDKIKDDKVVGVDLSQAYPTHEWYEEELARLREENMDLRKLLKLALDKMEV